ncbi:evolutionarily conserved signaling intermediate in Toll pathway, mitochondrial-like isoform X1 [Coccinella septempunctata]|uniref:evolutionarily conserved signaling intermediate in Toll pathway, mitochondrial-like isoform X1 n=1 Tax=Coccinella septempunctata TaxID=41139 RepID=UPI001D085DD1|nr:evolutionarily conserved signaling intermediate in Toll pathway, mitochondrial-like isoform X1 [Coccinella septempunctata]
MALRKTILKNSKILSASFSYYINVPQNSLRIASTDPHNKYIHTTLTRFENEGTKAVAQVGAFEKIENKNKNTYLEMVKIFINRDQVYRRGHVEFIHSALKHMKEFGVHKDLEVYRSLIDVLPKGKFVATNILQAEFMHYPKQQQCILDLLQQMEDNGVMPDREIQDLLINIFGKRAFPLRKYWRMMYWMPKFKHANPFPVPADLTNDVLELAKMAIARISGVDPQVEITEYRTKDIEDSIDDTWIVNAQSPTQRSLLEKHDPKEPVYVEGAFRVWLRDKQVNYFILRANPRPPPADIDSYDEDDVTNIEVPLFNLKPPIIKHIVDRKTVHEQDDGTIFAICATGTSSKDSLLSWIRHLEKNGNHALSEVPVVFTLRSAPKELMAQEETEDRTIESLRTN